MSVIEKFYSKIELLICPKCKIKLEYEDQGCWCCSNCSYCEYNNIERCNSDWCDNLILTKDFAFSKMEDRFCQVKGEHGETCLGIAIGEAAQFEEEDRRFREHIKGCTREDCDCRNY